MISFWFQIRYLFKIRGVSFMNEMKTMTSLLCMGISGKQLRLSSSCSPLSLRFDISHHFSIGHVGVNCSVNGGDVNLLFAFLPLQCCWNEEKKTILWLQKRNVCTSICICNLQLHRSVVPSIHNLIKYSPINFASLKQTCRFLLK